MIQVNKPFLPPREDYERYLEGIWERNHLTNHGPLVGELESKLKEYLRVPHLLFLNNGTMALQIAIHALDIRGEIITTPFSYIATTSSIQWENCKPVFVDIDQATLNIDPAKIEGAITGSTKAIIATHVYGNACDIDAIQDIARRKKLHVIYDAAHCFGVTYKGKSIYSYGDISTASFHATKLFHTVEGGAVFTNDEDLHKRMDFMRNFGHNGPENFAEIGINGKNSEFHAAMGLANLKYIDQILATRIEQSRRYDQWLKVIPQQKIEINKESTHNRAYYPIIFESEEQALRVKRELEINQVFPRRYFYPSLNTVPLFKGDKLPISESISQRIICLPLYYSITGDEIDFVSKICLRACGL